MLSPEIRCSPQSKPLAQTLKKISWNPPRTPQRLPHRSPGRRPPISRDLRDGDTPLRIGRFIDRQDVNALATDNITFRNKAVSWAHAEIWSDNGKINIKDTKSSGGAFVKHLRLSPADSESIPHQLKHGDIVHLGMDYQDGTEEVHKSVKFTIEMDSEPLADTNAFKALSTSNYEEDLTNKLQGRPDHPIGSGGFGDIWKCGLAIDNGTTEVGPSSWQFPTYVELHRVRRELKLLGNLLHDNILSFVGVADNFEPYPAMIYPWVQNGALTGFLERERDTLSSWDKFVLYTATHFFTVGSNVLVHDDGHACLADFGLSTIFLEFIGPSYFASTIRRNIRWAATELFEVPEDDEEDEAVVSLSRRCDIYSFGSIALQVLTCKVPYYNVKENVVLGHVLNGKKPEPPKESQIAPPHWEFIQQCWLPRMDRPLVAEIVDFLRSELKALLMDTDAKRLLDDTHGLPEDFIDDARDDVQSHHGCVPSSPLRPHTLLSRFSSLFYRPQSNTNQAAALQQLSRRIFSRHHPRPPVVKVTAAQDRQTLYVARRPEQPGDKEKEKQLQQGQSQGQAQASTSQTPPVAIPTPLPAVSSTTTAGAAGTQLQPTTTVTWWKRFIFSASPFNMSHALTVLITLMTFGDMIAGEISTIFGLPVRKHRLSLETQHLLCTLELDKKYPVQPARLTFVNTSTGGCPLRLCLSGESTECCIDTQHGSSKLRAGGVL
ncbi:kinase-like protein [Rhizopogon vinicolor AM-OR11-026]|uniref:Kinase-like protein n=1 Tax=Rhizopogon vinicolor AM-OR11-026 TaxID=1314800 RepID=A0A1B7MU38_9AGAM|nr:kinase-like protein [Rhizopogon vinicolor AM-OR11-026]